MPRGGSNYIPRPDSTFSLWAEQYYQGVLAFYTAQGLDPDLLLPLKKALQDWQEAYPAHIAAQAAAEGARAAKQAARIALEEQVRPVTNFVQGWGGTTDADRATIGITVRSAGKTPSPTPTSAPVVQVDSGQRLLHRLRFSDAAAPTRRGKPPGTIGAEVWLAITPTGEPAPPMNPRGEAGNGPYQFVEMNTRGRLENVFPSPERGRTAHYTLRWVSTRGEKGPWSEVASATIAA